MAGSRRLVDAGQSETLSRSVYMELIVRAVDVGSGNTKFVAAAVGSDIRCTSFPSVAYLYAIGAYNQNVVGSKADFGTAKRGEQAGEQSRNRITPNRAENRATKCM